MGLFIDRTYDYTKEHKELDHSPDKGVFCTHCGKKLDDRKELSTLSMMMMGAVWAKSNLPCKPYEKPEED
jgi:hypothetical protein